MVVYGLYKCFDGAEIYHEELLNIYSTKKKAENEKAYIEHSDFMGVSYKQWKSFSDGFDFAVGTIIMEEAASTKKGGWIKKFHREQLSKSSKEAYDLLCEIWEKSGKPSFQKMIEDSKGYEELEYQFIKFFYPDVADNFSMDEIKKIRMHFMERSMDFDGITYKVKEHEVL